MRKLLYFSILFLLLHCSGFSQIKKQGEQFLNWPQIKETRTNLRILIAETEELAHTGFCNASEKDLKENLIWFPDIKAGTIFVNTNPGYGRVSHDIMIVFFDKNWTVLKIELMKKFTGSAIAPEETSSALEGSVENIKKLGFEKGKTSPFFILKTVAGYSIEYKRKR